jgi:glutamate synthase (NADPH) large chain
MCGLGFVAELRRGADHAIVREGIEILRRLAHRGATGSDPDTGDGAGILLQVPDELFRAECKFKLPPAGDYAVAMVFLPRDEDGRRVHEALLEQAVRHHRQTLLGWRDVPVDVSSLGPLAQETRPEIRQLFIQRTCAAQDFERTLFMIRKRASRIAVAMPAQIRNRAFYISSFSSQTIVFKGLMLPEQLDSFYLDLGDPRTKSQLAVVHSRFSTNTFPTWDRAHPFRRIAHNGEINTLRGNQSWMRAREGAIAHRDLEEHLYDLRPIIRSGASDSASLDNVVDLLVAGGRSIAHVMMMLVPEAWSDESVRAAMTPEKAAFYEYAAGLVEPWDGPAALVFTDGVQIGATLDRNGLRPLKYIVTSAGRVIAASELGVLDVPPDQIVHRGRLQPGKMLLVDTREGRIVDDDEIKSAIAKRRPYARWLADNKVVLSALPDLPRIYSLEREDRERMLRVFGYTREDLRMLLSPMAKQGEEPTGSMGNDGPLAVLSERSPLFFRYFKQQFAQVTNPPIDPIREELVMSLAMSVGAEGDLLSETPLQCRLLDLPHPILTNRDLAKIANNTLKYFRVETLEITFPADVKGAGDVKGEQAASSLRRALERLGDEAERAVDRGTSILILSDRGVNAENAAIPSLLATSAVHHRLLDAGKRTRCGLLVESGEPREVADVALLIGYGASAVNPYLAFEVVGELAQNPRYELGEVAGDPVAATKNYVKALKKGLLKVLSKMGISTISSYHGAQIFEAVGVSKNVVERYMPGTSSRIGGVGLAEIALEALARHAKGYGVSASSFTPADGTGSAEDLESGGVYAYRVDGEPHLWSPATVASLQKAVRTEDSRSYDEYAGRINEQSRPVTLRGLWDLKDGHRQVALEQVEPATKIVRRFATGAMSFGSISKEAHENLAIAMNRIGGKSNSGEGGEDDARYISGPDGESRRSAIKQVASARFGVTAHFLINADEIQIKIAQGAKPGEGGQLPGHKVDAVIARVRHATPGVTLISPPPHHDIYSIEDLAQLIFDLKNVNPRARVSVKLVAESGVGTVAAGVAKARADAILISGHDGGTGASPLSSIHHAGVPWELGLSEAQQVLVGNRLRSRVRLQVDGQLKTGRDVAFAALLGAEEFGFATAPLVASGCIMMRKCHLNTCPVGVATQDPVLRARFTGQPEHVIRYFFFVAEELRGIMAKMGFRTVDEMIGRSDRIIPRATGVPAKARLLDFTDVLEPALGAVRRATELQRHDLDDVVDRTLIARAAGSIERKEKSRIAIDVTNADRAIGAMLSGEIARRHGADGLPEGTIAVEATGTAGQSFGAFAVRGLTLVLEGAANDYVGKSLSGGVLVVKPPRAAHLDDDVIVGNTVLYGAIAGRAFFAGRAGERFAVRNSGATAVVEGVGDHGCEYMTGGTVVVLGVTGRNFAAGMSGGVAYVYDEDGTFASRCNAAALGTGGGGAMIELSTIGSDASEVQRVHALIESHAALTGSPRAARLLASWPTTVRRIVAVVPTEYRRALEAAAARGSARG